MKIWSSAFSDGDAIPAQFAFAKPDAVHHIVLSDNCSPPLEWSEVPEGTRSFVLICHDPDVPSRADDLNQEGRTIPADLPRVNFYHWVLFDLPANCKSLPTGAGGITPRGKSGPSTENGLRHGLNDYTGWFAADPQMQGQYFGYDGPCPPWNDTVVHHYWFTLYALDVPCCPVEGVVGGPEVLAAIEGHVLAKATLMGTYVNTRE